MRGQNRRAGPIAGSPASAAICYYPGMNCAECERLRHEEAQATIRFVNADKALTGCPSEEWAVRKVRRDQAEAALQFARQQAMDHRRQSHPN